MEPVKVKHKSIHETKERESISYSLLSTTTFPMSRHEYMHKQGNVLSCYSSGAKIARGRRLKLIMTILTFLQHHIRYDKRTPYQIKPEKN